jgi:putative RNA 2'-phosphotransferase
MQKDLIKVSKYLSFILRHQPEAIALSLDASGWAKVDEVISLTKDMPLNHSIIQLVVETNDKQRFQLDSDKNRIRANQGHSIDVDLQLQTVKPPKVLLHGTAERFLSSILEMGLIKQNRHHVHLTESEEVAKAVGSRYGKPILLRVNARGGH